MTDTPLLDEKLRDGLGEIQTAGMAGDDLAMILLEPFSDMPDAQQCRDAVLDAIHHYYTRALSASRPAMGVKPLDRDALLAEVISLIEDDMYEPGEAEDSEPRTAFNSALRRQINRITSRLIVSAALKKAGA